jgi:hypothetical protein
MRKEKREKRKKGDYFLPSGFLRSIERDFLFLPTDLNQGEVPSESSSLQFLNGSPPLIGSTLSWDSRISGEFKERGERRKIKGEKGMILTTSAP